jgi:hypothetical protein
MLARESAATMTPSLNTNAKVVVPFAGFTICTAAFWKPSSCITRYTCSVTSHLHFEKEYARHHRWGGKGRTYIGDSRQREARRGKEVRLHARRQTVERRWLQSAEIQHVQTLIRTAGRKEEKGREPWCLLRLRLGCESMVLTKWSTQVDRPGVCPRISTLSKLKQPADRAGSFAPEPADSYYANGERWNPSGFGMSLERKSRGSKT